MILKATDRSTYLDVSKIDWEPTRYPGIETKVLYRDERGRQTTLTRMAPGARLPDHRHVGIEQSYVLQGTLVDDDGACTAGNFVWRRAGSVHSAWSPDGCVVLSQAEVNQTAVDVVPSVPGLQPDGLREIVDGQLGVAGMVVTGPTLVPGVGKSGFDAKNLGKVRDGFLEVFQLVP